MRHPKPSQQRRRQPRPLPQFTTSSDREARGRTLVPDLSVSPTDLAVATLDEVPDGDTEPNLLEDLVGVLSVQVDRDRLVRFGLELVGKDGDGVLLERPS